MKPEELSRLLQVESVQTDLNLTKEQKQKLSDLRAARETTVQNGINGGAGPRGIVDVFLVADEAFDKGAVEAVTVDQLRRIKQLSLQVKGPAALLDRRMIRALDLTTEQEDRIDSVLSRELSNVLAEARDKGDDLASAAQVVDTAWDAALKVLTPEQRKKWDVLIGKRMPAAELLKVNKPDEDD